VIDGTRRRAVQVERHELGRIVVDGRAAAPRSFRDRAASVRRSLFSMSDSVRWWDTRPAEGMRAKTYTCPICHEYLWAMNPNTLMFPEGDRQRRRHAHTECVAREWKAGRLLTKAEWQRTNRPPRSAKRSWWRGLFDPRA
jgi:hypothetical protein